MRLALLLVALLLVTRPAFAQTHLEVPVCQWGDCSKFCDPACDAGFLCSVEGKCVEQKTSAQLESDRIQRRLQARSLTRVSVGAIVGAARIEGIIDANVFALELGARQQLTAYVGISGHLGAAYGQFHSPGKWSEPRTTASSYTDFWADFIPYLGPLWRFYVGPALVLSYRHYPEPMVYDGYIPAKRITNRLRIETGGRLGLLLGSREQFNLWLQETSSLDDTTLNQTLLGFSVEFM